MPTLALSCTVLQLQCVICSQLGTPVSHGNDLIHISSAAKEEGGSVNKEDMGETTIHCRGG